MSGPILLDDIEMRIESIEELETETVSQENMP
jgi:hypothetical protein